jgi:site-specific DNA-cytosine methylase
MSLDNDPKCGADVCQDLVTWAYTDFSEPPDVIWCSPPCTHYSKARTTAKTPRDLIGSDAMVQRCLDIISFWRPKYWFIENPQTGLLKTRDVVHGVPFVDLDYCMYGAPYRKRTRIWTNTAWTPRPPCIHKGHAMSAQKGPSRRAGQLVQGDNCSLQTLHALPAALTEELFLYCTNEEQV